MNGILPLWKNKGMTSHDCVIQVRKLFQTKKVGHTGTLDPEVEGVLGICIGRATKVVPFLTSVKKTYIAECKLGKSTETEDAHGKVIESAQVTPPSIHQLKEALASFKGSITQIPPMYSAVKVKGKKLYEYARENKHVDRPERKVTIHELELLSKMVVDDTFKIKVVCSEGTYIRTLCVDIGRKLGYPAHMSSLIRTEASSFKQEDTVTLAEIEELSTIQARKKLLRPMLESLKHMDQLEVNETLKNRVCHGQKLKKPNFPLKTDPFLVVYKEQLLAIYETHPEDSDMIKPIRVFA